jgi:hypothetical protein
LLLGCKPTALLGGLTEFDISGSDKVLFQNEKNGHGEARRIHEVNALDGWFDFASARTHYVPFQFCTLFKAPVLPEDLNRFLELKKG